MLDFEYELDFEPAFDFVAGPHVVLHAVGCTCDYDFGFGYDFGALAVAYTFSSDWLDCRFDQLAGVESACRTPGVTGLAFAEPGPAGLGPGGLGSVGPALVGLALVGLALVEPALVGFALAGPGPAGLGPAPVAVACSVSGYS